MKNRYSLLLWVLMLGAISGCTINHPVAKDYPEYLAEHGNEGSLPKTDLESTYSLDGETQRHRYEFRAATVGYAHLWIVEFGKLLDETLNAPYVQSSFGSLQKGPGDAAQGGNTIRFVLDSYEFKDYRAYVSMTIVLASDGREILNKRYSSEGESKGGQMWVAGPFAMTEGTLDSTRSAIDRILTEFIQDIPGD